MRGRYFAGGEQRRNTLLFLPPSLSLSFPLGLEGTARGEERENRSETALLLVPRRRRRRRRTFLSQIVTPFLLFSLPQTTSAIVRTRLPTSSPPLRPLSFAAHLPTCDVVRLRTAAAPSLPVPQCIRAISQPLVSRPSSANLFFSFFLGGGGGGRIDFAHVPLSPLSSPPLPFPPLPFQYPTSSSSSSIPPIQETRRGGGRRRGGGGEEEMVGMAGGTATREETLLLLLLFSRHHDGVGSKEEGEHFQMNILMSPPPPPPPSDRGPPTAAAFAPSHPPFSPKDPKAFQLLFFCSSYDKADQRGSGKYDPTNSP